MKDAILLIGLIVVGGLTYSHIEKINGDLKSTNARVRENSNELKLMRKEMNCEKVSDEIGKLRNLLEFHKRADKNMNNNDIANATLEMIAKAKDIKSKIASTIEDIQKQEGELKNLRCQKGD